MPRLLAMRYAATLPAAAADAVSQPQDTAQEGTSESQYKSIARPSWRSTSATAAGSPSKSRWQASLSSSMDKLRALTSSTPQSKPAADPLDVPSMQHDSAEAVQSEQHAGAQEQPAPQQHSQQGGASRSYVPSWGATRYLPTFVPFGGQHHLYAPAAASGASPLLSRAVRPPESSEAEDSEALAALESHEDSSPRPRASAGAEEHQKAGSYPSSRGSKEQPEVQPASRPGTPPESASGRAQVDAQRAADARKYSLSLTIYHRMFTMRERAAAICSAVWSTNEGGPRAAVKLCQDLAPLMHVTAACAQLPILPPSPIQPAAPEPAYRRYSTHLTIP